MQHDNNHVVLHNAIKTPEGNVIHRYQCLVCEYDEIVAKERREYDRENKSITRSGGSN